jgi:hypothetical protein
MTKKELFDKLENIPDNWEIKIAFGCNFTQDEELSEIQMVQGTGSKIVLVTSDEIDEDNLRAMNTDRLWQKKTCNCCDNPNGHLTIDEINCGCSCHKPNETPLTEERKAILRAEIINSCKKEKISK